MGRKNCRNTQLSMKISKNPYYTDPPTSLMISHFPYMVGVTEDKKIFVGNVNSLKEDFGKFCYEWACSTNPRDRKYQEVFYFMNKEAATLFMLKYA